MVRDGERCVSSADWAVEPLKDSSLVPAVQHTTLVPIMASTGGVEGCFTSMETTPFAGNADGNRHVGGSVNFNRSRRPLPPQTFPI